MKHLKSTPPPPPPIFSQPNLKKLSKTHSPFKKLSSLTSSARRSFLKLLVLAPPFLFLRIKLQSPFQNINLNSAHGHSYWSHPALYCNNMILTCTKYDGLGYCAKWENKLKSSNHGKVHTPAGPTINDPNCSSHGLGNTCLKVLCK